MAELDFSGAEAAVEALEAAGATETTEVTALGEQFRANADAQEVIIADLRAQLEGQPAAQAKLDELAARTNHSAVIVQAISDALNPTEPTPEPPAPEPEPVPPPEPGGAAGGRRR